MDNDNFSKTKYLIHFSAFNGKDEQIGLNNLISIITRGLKFCPNEVIPSLTQTGHKKMQLIPSMICFANLARAYYKTNIDKYGRIGICVDRNWVRGFSGQPVFYTDPNNSKSILNNIYSRLETIFQLCDPEKNNLADVIRMQSVISQILLQSLTQNVDDKEQNEWRVINLEAIARIEEKRQDPNAPDRYIPLPKDNQTCFFLVPGVLAHQFLSSSVDKYFKDKMIFTEDFINDEFEHSVLSTYNPY